MFIDYYSTTSRQRFKRTCASYRILVELWKKKRKRNRYEIVVYIWARVRFRTYQGSVFSNECKFECLIWYWRWRMIIMKYACDFYCSALSWSRIEMLIELVKMWIACNLMFFFCFFNRWVSWWSMFCRWHWMCRNARSSRYGGNQIIASAARWRWERQHRLDWIGWCKYTRPQMVLGVCVFTGSHCRI